MTKKTKTTQIDRALLVNKNLLTPNPWNPNKTNERQQKAISESLKTYDQVLDIVVRPDPEKDGYYQIIDGEHRFNELSENVYVTVLYGLSDAHAKKLTIVLNETRGNADKIELAQLLSDISSEMDIDEILDSLPYEQNELEELIKLAEVDWDRFNENENDYDSNSQEESKGGDEWVTIVIRVSVEAMDVIEQAADLVRDQSDLHKNKEIAWGQIVEAIAADFLAK